MIGINILLGIAAAILLLGVIGEKEQRRHDNVTFAFVAIVALIIFLNKFI